MITNSTNLNTYLKHGTQNTLVKLLLNQNKNPNKKLLSLPICPKCERIGMRDKGWADHKLMKCPHCGYSGKATHVAMSYIQEGLYK